jgi:hypothetical protein
MLQIWVHFISEIHKHLVVQEFKSLYSIFFFILQNLQYDQYIHIFYIFRFYVKTHIQLEPFTYQKITIVIHQLHIEFTNFQKRKYIYMYPKETEENKFFPLEKNQKKKNGISELLWWHTYKFHVSLHLLSFLFCQWSLQRLFLSRCCHFFLPSSSQSHDHF